jgi:AbrB family looped-hinge helix DNA binding protein
MIVYPTPSGAITLPASLRRKYNITPKTKIVFIDNGDEIILRLVTSQDVRDVKSAPADSSERQVPDSDTDY